MTIADTEPDRRFVDTNIWLYALIDTGSPKLEIAKAVVSRPGVVISTQVISETCVNLLRQAAFSEATVRKLVSAFYQKYIVADTDRDALLEASRLREAYSLSFWDSMIVSCALRSSCDALYTEDMQDGLCIDGKLTIVNPFATKSRSEASTEDPLS